MQTPVTVVMLLHDIATETDRPVCKVLTGCSWRETRRTSASGDPQRGSKLLCGAVRSLTEAEYAALEKTHICCTVADVSDNRGVPLPHFHVEGS